MLRLDPTFSFFLLSFNLILVKSLSSKIRPKTVHLSSLCYSTLLETIFELDHVRLQKGKGLACKDKKLLFIDEMRNSHEKSVRALASWFYACKKNS